MVNNAVDDLGADVVFSLLAILVGTDVGVAVFTCASGIQGTVDMEDLETVETMMLSNSSRIPSKSSVIG